MGNTVGFRNGVNAHWMVVTGYLLKSNSDKEGENILFEDKGVSVVYEDEESEDDRNSAESESDQTLLLYCQHSQCQQPFVDTYERIKESNSQLYTTNCKFKDTPLLLRDNCLAIKMLDDKSCA